MTDSADGQGPVRVSFRSKPGPDAVDVAKVAGLLDGGGHARAAGAKVRGESLEAVTDRVRAAVEDRFGETGAD